MLRSVERRRETRGEGNTRWCVLIELRMFRKQWPKATRASTERTAVAHVSLRHQPFVLHLLHLVDSNRYKLTSSALNLNFDHIDSDRTFQRGQTEAAMSASRVRQFAHIPLVSNRITYPYLVQSETLRNNNLVRQPGLPSARDRLWRYHKPGASRPIPYVAAWTPLSCLLWACPGHHVTFGTYPTMPSVSSCGT